MVESNVRVESLSQPFRHRAALCGESHHRLSAGAELMKKGTSAGVLGFS